MEKRTFQFTVTKEDEGLGVKRILRKNFDFSSRLFTKLKHEKKLFLNGQVIEGWMQPKAGDVILAVMPDEESHFEAQDIPIHPVYEDSDLLILNKDAGYSVHPTKGHVDGTIANGIMKYMQDTNQKFKIRFVNRLDMDTSGLLIIGKNSHAQDDVSRQMKANAVNKYYIAIVKGIIDKDEFTIDEPIGLLEEGKVAREVVPKGMGRDCITHVKVLERFESGYTKIQLKLETGRTHQIRVHMSHIGHPVCGDWLYGDESELIPRQALHAYRLEFKHPAEDKEINVIAELPEDMQLLLEKIK